MLNIVHDGKVIFFTELAHSQIMLLINYGIQIMFLYEVGEMDRHYYYSI